MPEWPANISNLKHVIEMYASSWIRLDGVWEDEFLHVARA